MIGIRGTENFIWSVGDQIGSGITGSVFKCRDKKKGKPFAAKVLNANSELRPYEVRMRETEVLKKLSHPNIVLLFALEREHGSQAMVIIMELCNTSLYEILEQPENLNGLSDWDYLEVINDVSSGMEYLRASNVVHRDVKPGNILRAEKDNGRYIYKISDFGTARELGTNDKFTSYAYGTEEYLHPDLYERAVLRLSKNKVFDSTVDLWSLGVTFYHLATGQLPFQPYGGRQNKEVMFQMISSKKPGVISCYQDGNTGKLTFSDQLPQDTQITSGLKRLITPVLAGLLETDPQHMISHDMCFRKISNIVDRKAVNIFSTRTSMIQRLYLQQEDNFSHLQQTISIELGVKVEEQYLYLDFREFSPDPMTPILHYPEIALENPLILDTKQYVPSVDIPVKKIPVVQLSTPIRTLDDLAKLAKLFSSLSFLIRQDTDLLLLTLKAISKAHDVLEFNADSLFKNEKVFCSNLQQRVSDKWNHLIQNKEHLLSMQKIKSVNENQLISDDGAYIFGTVNKLLSKINAEFSDIFDKKVWIVYYNY